MVGKVTYKVTGVEEFTRNFKNLGRVLATRGSDEALIAAAENVKAEAKRLVPVQTGKLQRAIDRTEPYAGKAGERRIEIGVRRPQSRYAHFVEFGTMHHSARPYLRPALDAKNQSNQSLMARVLNRFMQALRIK